MDQPIETKPQSSRERMLSLAREHYPDRKFADLDATEPQEGVSNLDDAIDEMLQELTTKQASYDEKNNRLRDLLLSDPTSAEFIQKWIETGDPRTALVETFGDDLGMTEEGQAKFKDQLAGWRERKSANDALEAEAASNWYASLAAVDQWGDAKGLFLEQKRDVMLRLLSITFNGMENKYSAEDFDLAYNAINHDSDVAAARQEGEVAGRNEKISAARRERAASGTMPPVANGGQGGAAVESRPKPQNNSPWAGIR